MPKGRGKTSKKGVSGLPMKDLPVKLKVVVFGVFILIILLAAIQVYLLTFGRQTLPPQEVAVYALGWGMPGAEKGSFNACRDVACDAEGNVYVADTANLRIQKFDGAGKFLKMWGGLGSANGQFEKGGPCSVTVDKNGMVWTLDWTNNLIQAFDRDGQFQSKFSGGFYGPHSIQADAQGCLWVANGGGPDIQKFGPQGEILGKFGKNGVKKGQIREPKGVAPDTDGSFFIVDAGNRRLQKFNAAGKYLAKYIPPDKVGYNFLKCAVSPKGNLWVTDEAGRIWIFNKNLKPLKILKEPPQERFGGLNGIAFDGKGFVYVTNYRDNRVIKLGPILEP